MLLLRSRHPHTRMIGSSGVHLASATLEAQAATAGCDETGEGARHWQNPIQQQWLALTALMARSFEMLTATRQQQMLIDAFSGPMAFRPHLLRLLSPPQMRLSPSPYPQPVGQEPQGPATLLLPPAPAQPLAQVVSIGQPVALALASPVAPPPGQGPPVTAGIFLGSIEPQQQVLTSEAAIQHAEPRVATRSTQSVFASPARTLRASAPEPRQHQSEPRRPIVVPPAQLLREPGMPGTAATMPVAMMPGPVIPGPTMPGTVMPGDVVPGAVPPLSLQIGSSAAMACQQYHGEARPIRQQKKRKAVEMDSVAGSAGASAAPSASASPTASPDVWTEPPPSPAPSPAPLSAPNPPEMVSAPPEASGGDTGSEGGEQAAVAIAVAVFDESSAMEQELFAGWQLTQICTVHQQRIQAGEDLRNHHALETLAEASEAMSPTIGPALGLADAPSPPLSNPPSPPAPQVRLTSLEVGQALFWPTSFVVVVAMAMHGIKVRLAEAGHVGAVPACEALSSSGIGAAADEAKAISALERTVIMVRGLLIVFAILKLTGRDRVASVLVCVSTIGTEMHMLATVLTLTPCEMTLMLEMLANVWFANVLGQFGFGSIIGYDPMPRARLLGLLAATFLLKAVRYGLVYGMTGDVAALASRLQIEVLPMLLGMLLANCERRWSWCWAAFRRSGFLEAFKLPGPHLFTTKMRRQRRRRQVAHFAV